MSDSLYRELSCAGILCFGSRARGLCVCGRLWFMQWAFIFVSFCFLTRKVSAVCPGSLSAEQTLCKGTWISGICLAKTPDLDNVINSEWENRRREFYSFNFKIDLFSILGWGGESSGIANECLLLKSVCRLSRRAGKCAQSQAWSA